MLKGRDRNGPRTGRNIIYAIVITTIISMTAAGSGSAAFSFFDVFAYLGLDAGFGTTAYAQPAPTCVSPPPQMIAWWTGDDTSKDRIGPNDGQLVNGAAYAPGKVASGFRLFGGNSAVQVPDSPMWDFGTGDFTIDTWVNLTPQLDNPMLPGPQVLVAHDEGPGNIPKWMFWIMEREGTNRLEFYSSTRVESIKLF